MGKSTLSLKFTGELNEKLKGFYRSSYLHEDGTTKWNAVTQFEATDARRAFPCWDEPSVKATFGITLVAPKGLTVLSNMPEKCRTSENESVDRVAFETSPIMSTYLLAFVVGHFDYVEGQDSDGVIVRVYAPLGKQERGRFALDVSIKTLPFYKDYFGIAYPLPKIDLIAIPDFAAGAMENWGLVTYREVALLIDETSSSAAAKQHVALVVGHELAHQWFGNYVTMEWWTHLWLNEGFASWIEYLCVDHCFPEYDIWTQFAESDYARALELDSLKTSHPIEVPVGHPDDIDEIFDAISYCKGASVIRMLHDFLGDAAFRKGLNLYLTRHAYKNTFTEDLWAALEEVSGKPVAKIMNTWTSQMGYPVVEISEDVSAASGNKRTYKLRQRKFNADGSLDSSKPVWIIPVVIATSANSEDSVTRFVLDQEEGSVQVCVPEGGYVKLNPGSVGVYRVQYSDSMRSGLQSGLAAGDLSPRDRFGLQSDLFALARAGCVSSSDVLRFALAGFRQETNFTVWQSLCSNLSDISVIVQHTDFVDAWKAFKLELMATAWQRLGWEDKEEKAGLLAHNDSLLRALVLSQLGGANHPEVKEESLRRLTAHADGQQVLKADLRGPVYSTAQRNGGMEVFDILVKMMEETDLHEERMRIMRCLGAVEDEARIQRVLDLAMSDKVRSQDTVFVIGGLCGTLAGRKAAWKHLCTNWAELRKRFSGLFLLGRLIKMVLSGLATEEDAVEVETFFAANEAPSAERAISQAVEHIRVNASHLKRDREAITDFLKNYLK